MLWEKNSAFDHSGGVICKCFFSNALVFKLESVYFYTRKV